MEQVYLFQFFKTILTKGDVTNKGDGGGLGGPHGKNTHGVLGPHFCNLFGHHSLLLRGQFTPEIKRKDKYL